MLTISCTQLFRLASLRLALFTLLLAPIQLSAVAQETTISAIEDSVVKIYTTSAEPDYFTPWRLLTPRQSSGSGTVIEGNLILTNAHVVADASFIQAQKHNDPERYQAEVVFISHEADLALITVTEPGFFSDLQALTLGALPKIREAVSVFGYPIGGKTLSVTEGVLSRVEHQRYAHAGSYLLAGQIDAAINPGNSGGPVVKDGQIVGVVMQANAGGRAENLGYFVPPSVISHVLEDSRDGKNDGFPDLGFRTQTLDSPAAKRARGLQSGDSGVLVIKVFEESPVDGVLQRDDVVLNINGYDVADDGSISINDDMRTDYKHAIDLADVGEPITLTYIRDGDLLTATVTAREALQSYSLVAGQQYDQVPEYTIYGGILFVPLNMNLILRWGSDWARAAPVNLLQPRNEWSSPERREVVVALQVMAADVNLGYHDWRNWIVDYVNGKPVRDFRHFVRMLSDNTQEHVTFSNTNGYQMVINHQEALESEAEILARYRIPAAHSPGLLDE
ncbi:MAG: serine protease [Gammaproteobacteria bacterium]|nr:trypsin-like peptidase domain-containing protein [Pseudomonadales bacterium]MCP5345846.1 trypsin-like peptidase domain-containing protein [Pseudomonadales bacterium]